MPNLNTASTSNIPIGFRNNENSSSKGSIGKDYNHFDHGSSENNIYNLTKGNNDINDIESKERKSNLNEDYTHIDDGSNEKLSFNN